jgi:hypothetical protein
MLNNHRVFFLGPLELLLIIKVHPQKSSNLGRWLKNVKNPVP